MCAPALGTLQTRKSAQKAQRGQCGVGMCFLTGSEVLASEAEAALSGLNLSLAQRPVALRGKGKSGRV
jgi:hypothetical protein